MRMLHSSPIRGCTHDAHVLANVGHGREMSDDSWTNVSITNYLNLRLGPQQLAPEVVIPLTVVYVIIFISGFIGNVIVCLVIARQPSMQTATNYYLFSLAVSDMLLLLFGLPNDVKLFWQQYPWKLGNVMCKARALLSEATNYASVLTIVAFTGERYVAVCHPILSQTLSSLPRVNRIIGVTWILSLVSAIPFSVFTRVYYTDFPPNSGQWLEESAICSIPLTKGSEYRPLLLFSSLVFFLLPMCLIVCLYIRIALALRANQRQLGEGQTGDDSKRKNITKMLVAVVIAFFVGWAPFHAQRLLFVYDDAQHWPESLRRLNEILYFAGCFYYLSCTINPILYNVMSIKYREAFRDTLCNIFETPKRQRSDSLRSRGSSKSSCKCGYNSSRNSHYSWLSSMMCYFRVWASIIKSTTTTETPRMDEMTALRIEDSHSTAFALEVALGLLKETTV
uniref:G-protein coupled receptors family 1 profile domain-containing protein n=1 Tax=Strigamia maritima TaxID=126957 RepID=T1JJP1_STRMM